MTRNSMKLVISDHEVSDVQMALAREHHDRRGAFQNLQAQGHVRLVETADPARIHVQVEDEVLHDERARFPTTVLMAKLQLAIAAGRSCHNVNWDRDDDPYLAMVGKSATQPAMVYEQAIGRLVGRRPVGKSQLLAYDPDPLPKRVTAAVKKFARGLRP